jgi:tetratricopeptide (TPR) repeat protein
MKKLLFILNVLLFLQASAQETLTTKQWQKDLLFLQKTIHKDYSHLFVKTTKEIFDAKLNTLYKSIPNLAPHEMVVGLSRLVSLFKYGHTYVSFHQKSFEFSQLPFNLYEFSDGVYIQGTHKSYSKAIGAKVLAIEGKPILEALKTIEPTVESENSQYFKAYGINNLRYPEVLHAQKITKYLQKKVLLTLEKDGKVFTQSFTVLGDGESMPKHRGYVRQDENWLDAREQSKTPLYLKDLDKIYFFNYLTKEKALYVRHSRIANDAQETTENFYKRVFNFVEKNDVDKLIIDVRLNGGGNSYLNKSIITGIIETKKINKVGNLYVIIGRRTYSAAQNLVNELHNYTNAIFVGEPTAENVNFWGDARPVTLPNSGITTHLSYAWWQGKPMWEYAEWLAPQIPVEMSYSEYVSNQDPILEATLSFSGKDFILNPLQHIRELYMAGDAQKLVSEVTKMVRDSRYAFIDFEAELSKSAHRMLGIKEKQAAIQIFSFVTQLFPNSANAYKNLGEAYLKIGDKEKAKALLKKTISIDPNGDVGKNAKKILTTIK